ncbi:MAG: hypothetical protein AB3N23_07740 [Paracoccaceae bacterium]
MDGIAFEDTIDGYFPLHLSLRQFLDRHGFAAAEVILRYAPIMHIPNLPPEAPVPLNILEGVAGIASYLRLWATPSSLSGDGAWYWFESSDLSISQLDPMVRLAEPAFVEGIGFEVGSSALSDRASERIVLSADYTSIRGN